MSHLPLNVPFKTLLFPRSLEPRLRAAQCRLLYAQSDSVLVGAFALLGFVVFELYGQLDWRRLLVWAGVLAVIYALRFVGTRRYRALSEAQRQEQADDWLHYHLLGTTASGLAWGYCGYFLLPGDIAYTALWIVVIGGTCAASTAAYAPAKWGSVSLSTLTLLPFAINLLGHDAQPFLTMGIAMLAFLGVLLATALSMHASISNSLRLAIVNEELAAEAERARLESERLNTQLWQEVRLHAQAEETLRLSEGELSRILDNMQDTYYRTDTAGVLQRISPSVTSLLQYLPEELIGRKLSDLYVNPQGRERFLAALQANHGMVQNYTAPLRRKDGTAVWVSTNAHYYLDEQGKVAGIEGNTRDISEVKCAEEALFEAKERAEVALNAIGDGVIATDSERRVEYLNPIAGQLTGWRQEGAVGRKLGEVLQLFYGAGRKPLTDMIGAGANEAGRPLVPGDTILLRRNDGGEFAIEMTATPIRSRIGNEMGLVVVFRKAAEVPCDRVLSDPCEAAGS
jgi:PAS domain S-box-containing protein